MTTTKKLTLLLGDIAALYGALYATISLRYPASEVAGRFHDHFVPFSVLFVVWLIIFSLSDLYRQKAFTNYYSLANRVLAATGIGIVVSIILFYLFESLFGLTPRTNLLIFAVVFTAIDYVLRSFFATFVRRRADPVIVIGDSPRVRELIAYLDGNRNSGYRATRHLSSPDAAALAALPAILRETGARIIIVETGAAKDPGLIRVLYSLLAFGVNVVSFPDFYELVFERVPLDDLEEAWFIEHVVTLRPAYDRGKRLIDFVLAIILLVLFSPLIVLIGLMVLVADGAPVFYTQKRIGKNDRPFTVYKFRTMLHKAGGPLWTEHDDRRVTPFGKIIRATHLDELPQLWNIARGDLSFTGPRAERAELAEEFRQFPYYGIRHVVKPGLTGWAQINYRPSASLDEAKQKLTYDIYYVKNRSFLLDIAIILKTIKYVFTVPS